jgi:hypothetical protein
VYAFPFIYIFLPETSCFITDLTLSTQQAWNLYKQRANCKNMIKELKYNFDAETLIYKALTLLKQY